MTTVASSLEELIAADQCARSRDSWQALSSPPPSLVSSDYWLNSIIILTIVMGSRRPRTEPSDRIRRTGVPGVCCVHGDRGLLGLQFVAARSASSPAARTLSAQGFIAAVASAFCSAFEGLPSRASISAHQRWAHSSSLNGCSAAFYWFSNDSLTLTIPAPRLGDFRLRPQFAGGRHLSSPARPFSCTGSRITSSTAASAATGWRFAMWRQPPPR